MSMTPYSDEFMEAKVNNIYRGDPNLGGSGVYVNLTIKVGFLIHLPFFEFSRLF